MSRMQLEKQYKQLMEEAQPKKKKNKGLQIAGDVLVNVGKQQATNLLNKSIENQINKAFQVKADPKLLKKAEGMDLADLRKGGSEEGPHEEIRRRILISRRRLIWHCLTQQRLSITGSSEMLF